MYVLGLLLSCSWLLFYSRVTAEDTVLYLLGFQSLGGSWPAGAGTKMAAEMGIEAINARPDILPGYQLQVIWADTQCDIGVAVNNMYKELYRPPKKMMILGAGCSPVTQATARTSQLWNIISISYASSSPSLSDTSTYKLFFRLNSPGQDVNPAHVEIMRSFNWKRVATIHETVEVFSKVTDDFALRLQEANLTLITSEIFTDDPTQQVMNLKRHDARIIFVGCFPDKSVKLFCAVYKHGLYGPKYVWVLPGYYDVGWWKKLYHHSDCTIEQLSTAIEGTFGTSSTKINHKEIRGIAGFTPTEWLKYFEKRMEGLSFYGTEMAPMTYDTAWSAALALNLTVQQFKDEGSNKSLEDFSYEDPEVTQAIFENMFKVEFQGIKGFVRFNEKGDNEASMRIWRIQKGVRDTVGYYDPYADTMEWTEDTPIVWHGGKPPADSTTKLNKWIYVDPTTYITTCFFASLGIILSVMFGIFNFIFRKERLIKMSSPRMNNVIIAGCVVSYVTVFLQEQSDHEVLAFCKIRSCTLMMGFSMAFGALFAKTWRVYAIFMNQTKKVIIKDSQLFLLVTAIVWTDIIILVVREVVDPMIVKSQDIETVEKNGGDVVITHLVWVCTSQYATYFQGTVYTIKGLLLIFGAFLAVQTRKVKIPALNDSQYIGVCIYNVAVLSLLGVVLAFALSDQVVISYIFTCSVIIFGTTITQMIIFIPKIASFRSGNKVEDDEATTTVKNEQLSTVDSAPYNVQNSQLMTEVQTKERLLQEAEDKIKALNSEVETLKSRLEN